MRIGIIGDVHLGASYSIGYKDHNTGRNSRLLDYEQTLYKTIDKCLDEGCQILVFTGDIFEHRHPNALYQKLFSKALSHAIAEGIKEIHIVVGNHDQQRISDATTLSYLKELHLNNIMVHEKLSMVNFDSEKVSLFFMPYIDKNWLEATSYSDALDKIKLQLQYQIVQSPNDHYRLLVGHMTLEGTFIGEEYAELYDDNDLFLPLEMFSNIDATIMGHVHTPSVKSEKPYIAYVGSMEKRGSFENYDKKFVIVDTDSKSVEWFVEPCRDILEIKLNISDNHFGESLMDKLKSDFEKFSESNNLEDSILKCSLTLSAEDNKYYIPNLLEQYVKEKFSTKHCVPIKPNVIFNRQARDSNITENASDEESFMRYTKNTLDNKAIFDKVISYGLDIIKSIEVK